MSNHGIHASQARTVGLGRAKDKAVITHSTYYQGYGGDNTGLGGYGVAAHLL